MRELVNCTVRSEDKRQMRWDNPCDVEEMDIRNSTWFHRPC